MNASITVKFLGVMAEKWKHLQDILSFSSFLMPGKTYRVYPVLSLSLSVCVCVCVCVCLCIPESCPGHNLAVRDGI